MGRWEELLVILRDCEGLDVILEIWSIGFFGVEVAPVRGFVERERDSFAEIPPSPL